MSAALTAHQKLVALLQNFTPSPLWTVYAAHTTANLVVPALSVEVETDTPLTNDAAINQQELVDNREIRLSIRIHTGYRLGPIDTAAIADLTDDVIRWVRQHINLNDGYRIFTVAGVAYNVELTSSGTTGAEILVDIHKLEYYAQG